MRLRMGRGRRPQERRRGEGAGPINNLMRLSVRIGPAPHPALSPRKRAGRGSQRPCLTNQYRAARHGVRPMLMLAPMGLVPAIHLLPPGRAFLTAPPDFDAEILRRNSARIA